MVSGVLFIIGLFLLFFSYGGSFCLLSLVLVGFLVWVVRESNEVEVIFLGIKIVLVV